MLKIFRMAACVALFSLPVAPLAAESPAVTVAEVVATLEGGYAALTDLQANFSQRTTITSLNREEKGAGELFIKKAEGAAMFRFNYSKPRQQIVSNGKTLWYYLPENRQVMVSEAKPLFEGGNSIALNYLTGLGHVSRDFTARFAEQPRNAKGDFQIELVPKKENPALAKLRLTIAADAVTAHRQGKAVRNPFPILSSVVHDQLGNTTRIDYSGIKVNQGLGKDRFTFSIPAGVEVIKTGPQ